MTNKSRTRSITIFALNMGGSNACRLELDAIFTPPYNAARFGISLTNSPKQADLILLYGSATLKTAPILSRVLAELPDDVKLIALGSESNAASPFKGAYGVVGPAVTSEDALQDEERLRLPKGRKISAYIAGSPPDPQTILDGILASANF